MDPIRVLVIDDERVICNGCRVTLSEKGFAVDVRMDGRAGLDAIRNSSYDVVLLDLKLPDITGMDILKTVRKEKPAVYVIIMTGYSTVQNAVEAMKLGALDYLAKPFGTQEDLLITYGLTPADYTIGPDGNPSLTSDGKSRSQYVPWQYMSDRPYATYYAGIPNYAKHVNDVERVLVDPKIAVADVTLGFYSPTGASSAGKQGEQAWQDGINNIMLGRDPMSNYDDLLSSWQSNVGNQIKKEYNDAIAAAH